MHPPDMPTFGLLGHHGRVWGITGKERAIIKTITQEMDSEIKVIKGTPDSPGCIAFCFLKWFINN